ncbi:MAG: hypothetical protein KatS3mg105_1826 [Gemmatales bacterium]|nr:MAG: hypothetical protein KatS3mg105_1826 [Gemmatales bacterium]
MPFPDDSAEFADDEFPDEDADDQSAELVPCPSCRASIFCEAERCPHCGHYLSAEDDVQAARPLWFVVASLLALFAALTWVLPGC